MGSLRGIGGSIAAATAMAVASTVADLIWALWIPVHLPVYGMIHGALLFMFLGVVLGLLAGGEEVSRGSPVTAGAPDSAAGLGGVLRAAGGELLVGLAGAGLFYLLFPSLRWTAMFIAWMAVWVLTAFLNRVIRGSRDGLAATVFRGLGAALSSGLAFWMIAGIWLSSAPGGPNYGVNLGSWFVAFLPGFLCLLVEAGERRATGPA